jgi:hypothetical protein
MLLLLQTCQTPNTNIEMIRFSFLLMKVIWIEDSMIAITRKMGGGLLKWIVSSFDFKGWTNNKYVWVVATCPSKKHL